MYGRCERPFFWVGLHQIQEDKRHTKAYGTGAHDPMHVVVIIYKNVRACSINVVMAML